MNEQEMQFADPDWKPTGPLSVESEDAAAGVPLAGPVNGYARNVSQSASELYEQGYQGLWEEEPPSSTLLSAQQVGGGSLGAARRQSWWWLWLIVIVLLISLLGGMSRSLEQGPGFGRADRHGGFGPGFQQQVPVQSSVFYDLKGASQLTINDQSGSIIVQATGSNTGGVNVQTDDGSQPTVVYSGNDIAITSNSGGDVAVVVPQNVALHLVATGSGVIEVNNFAGQLSAQTDSGSITLNDDALSGQSTISSNSANINLNGVSLSGQVTISVGGDGGIGFAGTLGSQGKYQFTTDRGDIELLLPTNTSMQVQDLPGSGSFHNDFSSNPTGSSPQAAVTVKTNSGDIAIHHP